MKSRMSAKPRRLLGSLLTVGALVAAALAFATPAQATQTIRFTGSDLVMQATLGEVFNLVNASTYQIQAVNVTPGALVNQTGSPVCDGSPGHCRINSGMATLKVQGFGTVNIVDVSVGGTAPTRTLTITAASGSSVPQTVDLTVNVTNGYRCNATLVSGDEGTWATLPGVSDCSPPASKPNAKLLGWATQANFPVAIAKRQVDNGWGVYETFDSTGQLTGVFIPVGKPTWLSSPGQIYSIWSE